MLRSNTRPKTAFLCHEQYLTLQPLKNSSFIKIYPLFLSFNNSLYYEVSDLAMNTPIPEFPDDPDELDTFTETNSSKQKTPEKPFYCNNVPIIN